MKKAILARKVGMTQIFNEEGHLIPVTVLQAGPCTVTQVKTVESDGYNSVQVGFEEIRDILVNKPRKGHFAKAGVDNKRFVREFKFENALDYEVGQEIKADIFEEGDLVDVVAISKGKGTQGAIKRWNYGRGPASHGSKSHRVAGARAAGSDPARVFKGRKGSGKMGHDRVTIQNVKLVKVNTEDSYILVKGGVPGPKGGLVEVKQAVKSL